jgi:hypothetical protein
LLLEAGRKQIPDYASGRGPNQAHHRFFSHGTNELCEHNHKCRGQGPCRLGQSQEKGDEHGKHTRKAELDAVANGEAAEDLINSPAPRP